MEYKNFCKGLLVSVAVSSLFISGCSVNPATGKQQFTALMPEGQEASIGAGQHAEIIKQYGGLYKDQRVQNYVSGIGQKVARDTERRDVTYQFFVLDSPIINAFALPGGYIYVTRGLMAVANDEAELAGVLGHEVGHVTARHQAARYSQSVLSSLGANLIGAAVGNQVLSQALGVGNNLYISSYSRDQETEADALGIRYVRRADYDPQAVSNFLSAMGHYQTAQDNIDGKKQEQAGFFATHPATEGRVTAASAEASRYEKGSSARNADAYLSVINGITFGDSPEQGFVRGNNFYHPQMDFMFTIPSGYKIQNSPAQIIASGPDGGVMLVDGVRSGADPSAYIVSDWLKGEKPITPERITINGHEAATAGFTGSLNGAPVQIRLVAIAWGNGQIFRMQFATPQTLGAASAEDLKRTTYSFRNLTGEEKSGIRPQTVRIVTAQTGDTIQTMGSKMQVEKSGIDLFRALNDLPMNSNLTAGKKYKIIQQ